MVPIRYQGSNAISNYRLHRASVMASQKILVTAASSRVGKTWHCWPHLKKKAPNKITIRATVPCEIQTTRYLEGGPSMVGCDAVSFRLRWILSFWNTMNFAQIIVGKTTRIRSSKARRACAFHVLGADTKTKLVQ